MAGQFTLTIETEFAAAHVIRGHPGKCSRLHGHNWKVTVSVRAAQLDDIETVMDFHELASHLEAIIEPWHNSNLNEQPPFADPHGGLAINPTAERVAEHIGQTIAVKLPDRVTLDRVTVGEAPGCTATYRPGSS